MILLASGSEVHLVLAAREPLRGHGIRARVVSMPSLELFAQQPATYRDEVLPPGLRHRLAVEAAHPMPWYRWVGDAGEVLGVARFGASAPYERIYQELGLTPENIVARVRAMLDR